jgi:two-component system, chemotaxis family, sensor kinase CheA
LADGPDPNLIQDFLTESGELIEQLDADLVKLEADPTSKALLDGIFRALHTIKGAASFLSLPDITTFAHAAEDALNRLRKGEVDVDSQVIDALLRSTDVVRGMLQELGASEPITPGPADLVETLHEISERGNKSAAPAAGKKPAASPSPSATPGAGGDAFSKPLVLSSEKQDLLGAMRDECLAAANVCRDASKLAATESAAKIAELVESLAPTVDYFGFPGLAALTASLKSNSASTPAMHAAAEMFDAFATALAESRELAWTAEHVTQRLSPSAAAPKVAAPEREPAMEPRAEAKPEKADKPDKSDKGEKAEKGEGKTEAGGETTVRVEVARLESLLNLVGELVLAKNQVLGMAKHLRGLGLPHDVTESVTSITGQLDRLTGELQVGVMRTRMQPLSKLFSRYPRVVRDLARATNKQINIEVSGGDTEVDKGVLEALSDPMVHILRNSADHGVELPDVRVAAGKSAAGTIRISAEHRGGHVRVEIADDGRGIDPEVIGPKAVQKGVITAEQLAQMTPQEVVNLIFAPGFSTAEKVSDLSGRGVGMDVVRTNILKLGGDVEVTSIKGKGTRIEVMIPLTVAILPAMLVGVGKNQYALPVANIVEIVRLASVQQHSVAGRAVMRLREQVLPLVDLPTKMGDQTQRDGRRFAVVVEVGQQRAGLVVDDLIGQQEVVIKPLDDAYTAGGPFSGATIREDGDVSLIIDAGALVRGVQGEPAAG